MTGGTEGKTYKVTEITNGGFNFQKEITSVVIPYSVKTIKNSAFNMTGCESKLTSLTLSEGLVEICRFAFANISITSLKLPSTVKKVDGFNSCSKLSDVTLNEGLTVIERQAFYCCPIEEIEFPKSLEDIGEISFECTKIQNVNIPANVEHIGRSAFKDVTFGLNSVTFEDTKTDWTITDITKTPEYEFWIPSTDGTVNAAKIKESNVQSFMKNKLKKINLEQIQKGKYIHYRHQVPPELYYGSRYQAIITLVENSYATAYSSNVKFYVEKIAEGDERLSLGYNDLTKDISITKLYLNDKLLYKDYDFYVNNLDKYISFNTGFSTKDVLKIEFQLLSEPEFGMDMWFSD